MGSSSLTSLPEIRSDHGRASIRLEPVATAHLPLFSRFVLVRPLDRYSAGKYMGRTTTGRDGLLLDLTRDSVLLCPMSIDKREVKLTRVAILTINPTLLHGTQPAPDTCTDLEP
jgi:hypothetical protein